jgi:hypothetical protein
MNAILTGLLRRAGVEESVDWKRATVLYNYAPVPPPEVGGDMIRWNRGFNLVISAQGEPRYFAKCRPFDDHVLEWETEIRSVLAGRRPGSVSVGWVKTATEGPMTVQVSPFLLGPHYGTIVGRQPSAVYVDALRRILTGMRELAAVAVSQCIRLRQHNSTVVLADEIRESLDEAAALIDLTTAERTALAEAAALVGSVAAAPQHGDLWWQNLIAVKGELWAIDFDSYGNIRVPMFDDFTLTLTTLGLRSGGVVEGLDALMSNSAEAASCRTLLAEQAQAAGLRVTHLNGLLVYYLVTMASTIYRRGGRVYSAPYLTAVRHAAGILASGKPLLTISD